MNVPRCYGKPAGFALLFQRYTGAGQESGAGVDAGVLTAMVMALTLLLMLIRPKGLNEAWFAAGGACILVLAGVLPLSAPAEAVRSTHDVLVFLAAMMLLVGVVDRAGVIELVAERLAAWCGDDTRVLYIAMFGLSAVVTATLSLDITIVLVTPILYAVTRRRGIDPVPFLFACAFVANIGSLILPVSNLTNLLLVNRLDLQFGDFVKTMWFPNTVALITTLLMFLWLFRTELRAKARVFPDDAIIPGVAHRGWQGFTGTVLVSVIAALLIAGFADRPVWIPALAGATVLVFAAIVTRRITIAHLVNDLAPALFVFVIAMTMLVAAINTHVLNGVDVPVPHGPTAQVLTGVAFSTIASNVINNVPATVIVGELLATLSPGERTPMAYASLVGANIGPALTTYGSLATMLWLSIIRKRGTDITTAAYLRVSLITVPVVLLTTSVALWCSLSWF